MTPGQYPRTAEVRARQRASARYEQPSCGANCTCGRHRVQIGRPGRPCEPDCTCGRHARSREHNARIGMSVALTHEAKKRQP